MHFSTLLALGGFAQLGLAGYSLKDNYSSDKFFDMFNFDTVSDDTPFLLIGNVFSPS